MAIQAGQHLLHYRLTEKVGEGGMGVVWKAIDTTLDREVAIKVLPEGIAAEPERLARFEREAKLLAVLDHPNIAAVYGLHEAEGQRFIAMEFVPGEDLAERLTRGKIPTEDALDIARQVAGALEAAHEQGVIHRDLKPANIKWTPDGKVKVLDLGLAKALIAEASGDVGSVSMSPTITSAGTIAGTLLGTAAYMSPEQAKGRTVDRRADIWAFGVVLHEMLTGRKMFEAETISETLAAVLRDEVSLDDLSSAIPAPVTALLKRCLDRDPQRRLRDIGEARIALAPENLAAGGATPAAGSAAALPARGSGRERLLWAAAVLLLGVVAVVGWTLGTRTDTTPPAPEVRASIVPPEGEHFGGNNTNALSISPDGTRVTFAASTGSGRTSLYLRALGATEARRLPGTEGATYPFWSPDSRWIAFFADGKLKKLDLDGGAPMTITSAADGRGGTWAANGTILYAPETQVPIHRVSEGGDPGGAVTTLDPERGGETSHRHPSFLPNGRHYLFLRVSHHLAPTDDANSIWIGDLESGDVTELMPSTTQAAYAQGHIFWVRDRFLMARPFSTERLQFTGNAFAVGEGVAVNPGAWRGAFALSETGPLAFHGGTASERILNIFDRDGNIVGTLGEEENYTFIRLSPDDRFLAATIADRVSGQADIWIHDLQRNVKSRLTFHEAEDKQPVWSPDGERIAFSSGRDGQAGIFVRRFDGKGDAELLFSGGSRAEPEDWSHDGKYLAYNDGAGKGDLSILSVDDGEVFKLVETEFDEGYARFSPDDRWIAYLSNESGRYDLYITRFPEGEGKWQLTTNGADWLVGWNDDGDEVYYLDPEGNLAVIRLELGAQVVIDSPKELFPAPGSSLTWANMSDGQRFVLGTSGALDAAPVTLILNWDRGGD